MLAAAEPRREGAALPWAEPPREPTACIGSAAAAAVAVAPRGGGESESTKRAGARRGGLGLAASSAIAGTSLPASSASIAACNAIRLRSYRDRIWCKE